MMFYCILFTTSVFTTRTVNGLFYKTRERSRRYCFMAFFYRSFGLGKTFVQRGVLPVTHLRRCFGCNVPLLASADDTSELNKHCSNIFTSKSPKVDLIENKSLPEIIFKKYETFGNKRAIVDGITGHGFSFLQLQELTLKCASALTKLGFKKEDVFAIYCTNCPEFPIIYLAVLSLGGIITTVSSLATVHEISKQLKDLEAKYIFTVPLLAPNAKHAAKQCGLKEVIVVGEAEGCRPLSTLFQDDGRSFPKDVTINPKDDIAVMPYSSGTTGVPKGVMLTHFNLSSNIQQCLDHYYHNSCTLDDKILGLAPFFHVYGLNVVLPICLYRGSTIVTLPRFEESSFLETMQNLKISKAFITPPLALFLAKSPLVDKYNFPALDYILSGAAPLSGDVEEMLLQRLEGISSVTSVKQGYGLTEASPVLTMSPTAPVNKVGAAGNLVSETEAKVVHMETREALGQHENGELCVRGPQVMKGYFNNPEATKDILSPDGWLSTGDIGYYDSDEFLYIVDRSKELIKYKGYQVAPAELEAILISHPKIHDAAVIGVSNVECGEMPKAFVSGSGVTGEELHNYVNGLVAPYKKLRGGIEFIDEIPKSNTGKILRRLLKDKQS